MAGQTPFANRYAAMYNINYGSLRENPYEERKARNQASTMKALSALAPMAGAGIGAGIAAAAGAPPQVGMSIGQSLGEGVGAAGNAAADSELDDERLSALRREALMAAIRGLRR